MLLLINNVNIIILIIIVDTVIAQSGLKSRPRPKKLLSLLY